MIIIRGADKGMGITPLNKKKSGYDLKNVVKGITIGRGNRLTVVKATERRSGPASMMPALPPR